VCSLLAIEEMAGISAWIGRSVRAEGNSGFLKVGLGAVWAQSLFVTTESKGYVMNIQPYSVFRTGTGFNIE
jgi:hypothetical protein